MDQSRQGQDVIEELRRLYPNIQQFPTNQRITNRYALILIAHGGEDSDRLYNSRGKVVAERNQFLNFLSRNTEKSAGVYACVCHATNLSSSTTSIYNNVAWNHKTFSTITGKEFIEWIKEEIPSQPLQTQTCHCQ
eukprot:TRINITY_DN328_c0_g1_i2.p1 TRINITY_DN328_c0_g1~~TRINITY_DN328_c0_g1_i2.p1  ORF type:complete len:135 (-),score=9.89 TRINITY_DN328_c0_g1_i2:15-419(-)